MLKFSVHYEIFVWEISLYMDCCTVINMPSIIFQTHYNDIIMSAIASRITSIAIVCSTVYSGADKRKHQSSPSLAFGVGNGEFPTPKASNAENVSIWWRYHVMVSIRLSNWILCCEKEKCPAFSSKIIHKCMNIAIYSVLASYFLNRVIQMLSVESHIIFTFCSCNHSSCLGNFNIAICLV